MKKQKPTPNQPTPPLSAHVITEGLTRKRFADLLDDEHRLGSRQPKGRTLHQVVCRGDRWIGLSLWTAALWHFKSRDQRIGWDPVMRSERLQLIIHQSRFLVLEAEREPNLASQLLAVMVRELPRQWEECFGYQPLLAETFTDPQAHHGTCYKAAGWEPVGFSRRDGRHYAEKLPEPLSSKKMWIKPLLPKALELLVAPELPEARVAGVASLAGERLAITSKQLGSLFDVLRKITDPRSPKARQFPLGAVLSLIVLGLLETDPTPSGLRRRQSPGNRDHDRLAPLPGSDHAQHHAGEGRGLHPSRSARTSRRWMTSLGNSRAGLPPFLPRTAGMDASTSGR